MITEQEMNRTMMTLKIIWGAILMSLAFYLAAGLLATPSMPSAIGSEAFAALRRILYGLAIAALVAARYIRRLILAGKSRDVGSAQAQPTSPMQRYTSAVIVTLALSESVGIFGLVLCLLGKNSSDLYLLLGISAAAMIYYRPRKEELKSLCQDQSNGLAR